VIKEQIKQPISEEILFGALEHGGSVFIDEKEGALTFSYESNEPDIEEDESATSEPSDKPTFDA
jgi:hypothetical protein